MTTTTTTTEISPFFCGSLLFSSCSSAIIFIRFWVMILRKLSSGFSLTFSHNLPVCNTAYDSYPGCLVTILSVLFAGYALRQKKQLSVEHSWLGYHMRSVGGTCGGCYYPSGSVTSSQHVLGLFGRYQKVQYKTSGNTKIFRTWLRIYGVYINIKFKIKVWNSWLNTILVPNKVLLDWLLSVQ